MQFKKKKKKEKFVDDGRVIASMDSEYINGYKSKQHRENREALRDAQLSLRERLAIYKAVLANVMPVLGIFLVSIILVICFLYYFWMN